MEDSFGEGQSSTGFANLNLSKGGEGGGAEGGGGVEGGGEVGGGGGGGEGDGMFTGGGGALLDFGLGRRRGMFGREKLKLEY